MRWDILLEWMTHMGSGRWGAFREAVADLTGPDDPDVQVLSRALRIALSDLGHANFFVDGAMRWQVLRPALVALTGSTEYLFVGGRTWQLSESLALGLQESGASISITEVEPGLARICLTGRQEALRATAEALGLEYIPKAAALLASRLPPIGRIIEEAPVCTEPLNWDVRSWSFEVKEWIPGRLPRTAREYTNRRGIRRYMIHLGHAGLREVDKRISIYGAALLKDIRITRYIHETERLLVPRWAPLPELYSRALCLAGGQLAVVQESNLVFEAVNHAIASIVSISLGQGFPMPGAVS